MHALLLPPIQVLVDLLTRVQRRLGVNYVLTEENQRAWALMHVLVPSDRLWQLIGVRARRNRGC